MEENTHSPSDATDGKIAGERYRRYFFSVYQKTIWACQVIAERKMGGGKEERKWRGSDYRRGKFHPLPYLLSCLRTVHADHEPNQSPAKVHKRRHTATERITRSLSPSPPPQNSKAYVLFPDTVTDVAPSSALQQRLENGTWKSGDASQPSLARLPMTAEGEEEKAGKWNSNGLANLSLRLGRRVGNANFEH